MNKITKRGLSLMLALIMCLSLLAGINFSVFAATGSVSYRYDGSYVYNWGTREEEATFLSPMAIDYYEKKNTSYEALAALSGNSNQTSAGSSALYYELQEIMSSGAKSNSYDANKTLSKYTDCQNNGNWNSGKISSFYSGTGIGPSWNGEWNREHTWPNSKGGGNCENIFMIRPTSYSENSSRGNTAYGKSSGYYNPNNESGGKHDLRGDVARLMLGIWVCYGSNSTIKGKMWGSSGVMESKTVLLEWIEADPVDTWELGRNDSVESILNFRNVFVDYPELAFELFEEEIPEDMKTPSGIGGTSAHKVSATVNNASYGSVTVSGKTITATPATGYEVTGYTVTSGQATVTRNGNVFTVSPSSDCTIKINFAKRTVKQASFYGNGAQLAGMSGYSGDQITLPTYAGQVPEGWSFTGWVTKEVEETTQRPAYTSAGAKYTLTDNVVFYALFSKVEEGTTGSADSFTRYSGALTEGDYILTSDGYAMVAEMTTANKDRLQHTAVTVKNDTIENPAKNIVWHISFVDSSKLTIYNAAVNQYAGSAEASNKARLLDNGTDSKAYWTYTGTSTYEFSNVYNANNSLNKLLHRNPTVGFGCYSSTTGGALTLYKAQNVTTYYTTYVETEAPVEDFVIDHIYENGGVEVTDTYDSLEEALDAAISGTVILQSDVSAGALVVKPDVTLDLNGYTLHADALIAMDGATVCDGGADCTGGGLLSVASGNLALAEDNGNGIIPVWNGVDGYIFTRVTFGQTTGTVTAETAQYIFLPVFSNAEVTELLADGGVDNELSIKTSLTWNNGYSQQLYTFSEDLLKRVYDGTGSLAFQLTVTGISGIADLVASPVVATRSGTQATASGKLLTAN